MGGPGWLSGTFAALMLTVAAYCTGRLVASRRWRRPTELDTDGAHVLMGVAMAGMLVAGLRTLPAVAWDGVFAAGTAWFGGQALRARGGASSTPWRCLRPAPHLVECAAMLYMFLVFPAPAAVKSVTGGAMGGMGASAAESRFSLLALLLALFMLGWVVRLGDQLTVRVPAPAASLGIPAAVPASPGGCGRTGLAPRCAALCKIAMAITMGYTLILML